MYKTVLCVLAIALATCFATACVINAAGEFPPLEAGYTRILGTDDYGDWKQSGPGKMVIEPEPAGAIRTEGGMGLFWYPLESYKNFVLKVDWMSQKPESNSGVFVRFPDPGDDPWVAVNKGHEIQICDTADPKHRTGSVYSFAEADPPPTRPIGEWNTLTIRVSGNQYTTLVNDKRVCRYKSDRSLEGYVGLQNHGGDVVWFRNVRVKELP